MLLIDCPACASPVSSAAAACPKCAHPITTTVQRRPVTIEQTNKKFKVIQLIGTIAVAIGLFLMFRSSATDGATLRPGIWLAVLGLIGYYVGRAGAWWRNG